MKIDIVGWKSIGLRSPDMEINLLREGKPAKVALIQMPNGTGKTTTLRMLTATLTGTAIYWKPDDIRELRRPEDTRSSGTFRVDLQADDNPVTFELTLDFDEGTAHYRTTNPKTGGVISKWEPPVGLHRFLTPDFIKLFVFDGEFAERLLDKNNNEAERAIDALCQLYLVDEIAEIAGQDWEQAVRGAGSSTVAGLTMAMNKLGKINAQIVKMSKARANAAKGLADCRSRIQILDGKISVHISEKAGLRNKHEMAILEKSEAEAAVDKKSIEMMGLMRSPHTLHASFGKTLATLKQNLDRLKLPEATSRQFFLELAEETLCVCGRPLDSHTREEIITRSHHYLGQEEAGSINALKRDIETHCGDGSTDSTLQLEATSRELAEVMRRLQLADQSVRSLKQSLIDSGDEALASLEAERSQLASKGDELDDLLGSIDEQSTGQNWETTYSLLALKEAKKETEEKVTAISGTLNHKEQIDVIKGIANRARQIARTEIREALRTECNDLLLRVLGNDPLQIESIGTSLTLLNQKGASVGQTLSVGYTFLMSLLNRGDNHFPLVVDSPCGSLDGGRRKAIGQLIPQLCTQFITFVIDTERDDFLPALESSANGDIKYLTAFRNTPKTAYLLSSLPETGVVHTPTATLVEGREYFVNFREH